MRAEGSSRLRELTLEGPAGPLEALLLEREDGHHAFAALICHPHPLYGGTLHNKVVHRAATTLFGLGGLVLRFNFRGVGKSQGRHDRGQGELEDARAALRWLRDRDAAGPLWVAGFSFGSWVGARLAASEAGIEQLLLIAPPVSTQDFSSMRTASVPKTVFHGTADTTSPIAPLREQFPTWADPKRLYEIAGATHFFDKQLADLSHAMSEAMRDAAGGHASETG
jgi:alpha/beta superfamily hydrolase